ncbi:MULTISPECIES: hypothetical protein [Lysobacter]|uniref:hypothetical protein n=1 Tax=Lysobacter TaxID=68 RepID=UPI001F41317C|nr:MULTISPECIES: hypothetical protein [Lysobacter]UJB19002.1 hypothetical protein L1A79_22250 [Lysobacter capsici]UJQ27273.1 hypothetical protein L2D09_17635 [Lysobacter gummosus]
MDTTDVDKQRRTMLRLGAAAPLAALAGALPAEPAPPRAALKAPESAVADGRHDFDFYHGRWQVKNRRLAKRLAGSRDWIEFDAADECHPVLGGLGSVDRYLTDWNGGIEGFALRLYRPQTRQWHVYWASDRDGVLEAPLIGGFRDGVGVFEGQELHEGAMLPSRALWTDIRADSVRWEQALSPDGGKSWETNWVMHMTRLP